MKKHSFILELVKSGPFRLLIIIILLILLGIVISNHHKSKVQMKEDVLYVAPNPQK